MARVRLGSGSCRLGGLDEGTLEGGRGKRRRRRRECRSIAIASSRDGVERAGGAQWAIREGRSRGRGRGDTHTGTGSGEGVVGDECRAVGHFVDIREEFQAEDEAAGAADTDRGAGAHLHLGFRDAAVQRATLRERDPRVRPLLQLPHHALLDGEGVLRVLELVRL